MMTKKRRLLSLLMAIVMICSLVPTAFAEGIVWGEPTKKGNDGKLVEACKDHTYDPDGEVTKEATCTDSGEKTYTCTVCGAIGKETIPADPDDSKKHVYTGKPLPEVENGKNTDYHYTTCAMSTSHPVKRDKHDFGTNKTRATCSECGAANPDYVAPKEYTITLKKDSVVQGNTLDLDYTVRLDGEDITSGVSVKWSTSSDRIDLSTTVAGRVFGRKVGRATISGEFTINGDTVEKDFTIDVTNPFSIDASPNNATIDSSNGSIELTAYLAGTGTLGASYNVSWSFEGNTTYFAGQDNYKGGWTVTVKNTDTVKRTATVGARCTIDGITYSATRDVTMNLNAEVNLTATVSSDYYFGDVGEGSSDKYSIKEQLENYIDKNLSTTGSPRYLDYVYFTSATSNTYGSLDVDKSYDIDARYFGDILFTPKSTGKSTFNFVFATVDKNGMNRETYSGTITITVTSATSTGDVVFYGEVGDTIYFDAASFEDFWKDNYSSGTLDYVNFSVSGGTLRDGDGKSVTSSRDCYVNPRSNQVGLDDLYFEPSSSNSKTAVTIKFSFTAYGTTTRNGSTNSERKGTVSIVYMNDSPSDINYNVGSNGTVSLKASDFTAAYKEATGSSAPSNLTIVFQNVPRSGSLSYTDSSKKNSSKVNLTNSNIKSRSFITKSSGSNQIGDITYTGNSSNKDSIEYVAYSGTTPKFKGNVTFNGSGSVSTDISVTFYSTNGNAAQFLWSEFTRVNSTLSNASTVRFSSPSSGTLYLNGSSNAVGIDLTTSQVNSVTYRPKAGFNSTDRVVFMAYDSSKKLIGSGTVIISVSGNATVTTPTTPTVSPFTDVKTTDWYYADMATLYSRGIMVGKGNGRFDPNGQVTYGEALKLVMETCGYSATVGTGSNWASDYKTKAVARGWVLDTISVTAPITRNAVAELVCKVLNITPTGKASPYADSANIYGIELYYTYPQIFVGSTNPNGGLPLFNNDKDLTRAQVCSIICRLESYNQSHIGAGSGSMPEGT